MLRSREIAEIPVDNQGASDLVIPHVVVASLVSMYL